MDFMHAQTFVQTRCNPVLGTQSEQHEPKHSTENEDYAIMDGAFMAQSLLE